MPWIALLALALPGFTALPSARTPSAEGRLERSFQELSLTEALARGLELEIRRREDPGRSPHYGPCLELRVRNAGTEGLRTALDAGSWLHPEDAAEQDMLVTETRRLALMPGAERAYPLHAMCGQAADAAPGPGSGFAYGGPAPEPVAGLARLLERHGWQDDAGQAAVWALTDGHPIADIVSDNAFQQDALRGYVATALGLPEPEPEPAGSRTVRFELPKPAEDLRSGAVRYRLERPAMVSVGIQEEDGSWADTFVHQTRQGRGEHAFTFTVAVHGNADRPLFAAVVIDGRTVERQALPRAGEPPSPEAERPSR